MPYSSNDELPQSVRDVLPDAALSVFRRVYNSQSLRKLSEERSFLSAWVAVKSAGYEKDEKTGKWVKVEKGGDHDQKEHGNWAGVSGGGGGKGGKGSGSGSRGIGDLKSYIRQLEDDLESVTDNEERLAIEDALAGAKQDLTNSKSTKKSAASFTAEIQKLDEDQNLVFGFASIIEDEDGNLVVDSQGDVITPDELEKAAYDFMEASRKAGEMHKNSNAGVVVESIVLTKAKRKVMKMEDGPTGWWIGMRVTPEVFAKVKSGDYKAFSIGGKGERKEYSDDEEAV